MVRYCKKCRNNAEFVSSGNFRVNAQQKSLDVWLIYKCSNCDVTWNLTVLSRLSPRAISVDLLRGFHENDPDLAIRYATDVALIKRNGATLGNPEIEIVGVDVISGESTRIKLISEIPLEVKAETAIRNKLGLSRTVFDKLRTTGKLVCVSGHNLGKCKLTGEIIVELRQT